MKRAATAVGLGCRCHALLFTDARVRVEDRQRKLAHVHYRAHRCIPDKGTTQHNSPQCCGPRAGTRQLVPPATGAVCGARPSAPPQLTPSPCLAPPAPRHSHLFRRRCRHDWCGLGRHARGGAATAGQRRLLPAAALKHVLLTALAVNARRVARQLRLWDGGRRATASEVKRGPQVGHDESGGRPESKPVR